MVTEAGISWGGVGIRFSRIDIIEALKMTSRNFFVSPPSFSVCSEVDIFTSIITKQTGAVCNEIKAQRWKIITNKRYNVNEIFGK